MSGLCYAINGGAGVAGEVRCHWRLNGPQSCVYISCFLATVIILILVGRRPTVLGGSVH